MSAIVFTYDITLKKGETRTLELPNLKSQCLVLHSFKVKSDHKTFDIKLIGKQTILSLSEAVFYHLDTFDLANQVAQIVDADPLTITIKNMCTTKDANTVSLTITLNYIVHTGTIIYNNIYNNMNSEGLATILNDVRNAGKYITKIVWTSPQKLSSIEFHPQFGSNPGWLEPILVTANQHNQVIMDLSNQDESYDSDVINQLRYYTMTMANNVEKLGVVVYGFAN
jgi:hypothetical protein